jgi:hypothetical protein
MNSENMSQQMHRKLCKRFFEICLYHERDAAMGDHVLSPFVPGSVLGNAVEPPSRTIEEHAELAFKVPRKDLQHHCESLNAIMMKPRKRKPLSMPQI